MALLIHLPYSIILSLGLLIVAGHNSFDYIPSTHQGLFWDVVRNGNFATLELFPGKQVTIIYPFLPWLGLMMLGYCIGKIFTPGYNTMKRKVILAWTGSALI